MTPGDHDVFETASGLVNTVLSHELGVVVVWVRLECVRVDDLVAELASDDESITDNVPLSIGAEEAEKFTEIVDKTGQLHPVGLAVTSDSLGSLEQVFNLTDRCVRVRLVDEGVEHLHRFPDGHAGTFGLSELFPNTDVVLESLLSVLFL